MEIQDRIDGWVDLPGIIWPLPFQAELFLNNSVSRPAQGYKLV